MCARKTLKIPKCSRMHLKAVVCRQQIGPQRAGAKLQSYNKRHLELLDFLIGIIRKLAQ